MDYSTLITGPLNSFFNHETHQVDYISALCQDLLEQTVFVQLPSGFEVSNKVFLIQKAV